MTNVTSAITNTVSISLFNQGMASRIFDEVKKTGAKVVMKNDAAECVLLSPKEYTDLMEELNDARLLAIAEERLAHYSPENVITWEEMLHESGLTEEDLADFDEVEIE